LKKFTSISYFGVFIRGAQCPQDAFHVCAMAERMKNRYENDDFYKQFSWVVKPCRLGRNLTQRAEYKELVEKFVDEQESFGNIVNRDGVTVGLLRKFAVWLEIRQEKRSKTG